MTRTSQAALLYPRTTQGKDRPLVTARVPRRFPRRGLTYCAHTSGGQPEDAGLLSAATVNIFSSKSLFPRATEQQKSIWESTAFLLTLTETELEMPGSGATEPSPTIPSTRLSSRQTLTTDRP